MSDTVVTSCHCGAKTKRTGSRCRQPAMSNGRCRLHGGKTPAHPGPNLTAVKNGQWSKYAPVRLQGRIDEALADSELLSVKPALALLTVRLQDLMGRIDEAGFEDPAAAITMLDAGDYQGLRELLTRQDADRRTWSDLRATCLDYNRLADTEHRRMVASESFLTIQQVNVFLAVLIQLIREHVADPQAQRRIVAGVYAFCHRTAPARALPQPEE